MNATSILCRAQDAAAAGASRSGSGSGSGSGRADQVVVPVCGRRHFNFVTKLGRTQLTSGCHCLEEGDAVHGGICRAPEPLKSHFRTAAEELEQQQAGAGGAGAGEAGAAAGQEQTLAAKTRD